MRTISISSIIFCFSILFVVEGTINVCIPLSSSTYAKGTNTGNLLQQIKTGVSKKISENDEPIPIDHVDLNITHPAIRINGTIDHGLVYNVRDFSMCLLDVGVIPYINLFNLTFHNLRIEGEYNITGDLGDLFYIFGIGDFWLELKNMSIAINNFTITADKDKICLPINIDFKLVNITNHFDNLMGDGELEDLFNRAIESILPDALDIVWQELKDYYDGPIENAINNIFKHADVSGLLNTILLKSVPMDDFPYCYTFDDINKA